MRTLFLILPACLLTGCLGSTGADIADPPPPPSLTAPCGVPASLPARALSDQEVEVLWGRDRSGYRACASRHSGLAGWAVTHHGDRPAK